MLTRWVIIDHLGDVDDEDKVDFDLGKDDGLDGGIWHTGGDEGVTGVLFRAPSVSETSHHFSETMNFAVTSQTRTSIALIR